jgi:ferredoxin
MPKLTIDHREVEVPSGATILDAARQLGLEIPALCARPGYEAQVSCMACVVRIEGRAQLIPSCATRAEDGMRVESETAEIHAARRATLEMLLSDHVGDCEAPCRATCPAHMNIPRMLREIKAGQWHEALITVKQHIALPARGQGRPHFDLRTETFRRGSRSGMRRALAAGVQAAERQARGDCRQRPGRPGGGVLSAPGRLRLRPL